MAVVRELRDSGFGRQFDDDELELAVDGAMWRPEYLDYSTGPVDGAFGGRVSVVEHLGGSSLVTLDVAGEPLHVVVGEEREPEPGERGWALPRPGRVLLYRDGELVTEGGRSAAPLAKDGGHG